VYNFRSRNAKKRIPGNERVHSGQENKEAARNERGMNSPELGQPY